jgi:hypothetical protein
VQLFGRMVRRVSDTRALILCGVLATALGVPGVASASTVTGSVTMIGGQGDYVAGGSQFLFDTPGTISLSGNAGSVTVRTPDLAGPGSGYTIQFAAPTGGQLTVGEYDDAQRFPFESPGHPGIDVSGDGRGCNQDFGRFIVKDIHLDANGNIDRFWALYEQHCESLSAAPLFGEVRLNEPAPTAAEAVEPASILWPLTSVGTTGIYVPVTVIAGGNGAQIISATLTGADPSDFKIGSDGCSGQTLAASAKCQVSVALAPTASGDRHATLAITDALGSTTNVGLDYLIQPSVTSVSPTTGPPAGGTTVTIHGTQFTDVSAVHFGSDSASYTIDSPTQITATAPAGSVKTAVDVTVTTPDGDSAASSVSRFTYADPPAAPTNATASPGDQQAAVSFAGPSDDGGSPVTRYTVTASPGGAQATGTTSPITVTGLSDGIDYSFSVTATSAVGTSPSAVSNTITTLKPSHLTISASPDHAAYGVPITLAASVSSPFSGMPSGSVTFESGNTLLGPSSLDSNGQTSSGPSVTPDVGASIAASYSGDGAFKSSTATLTPTITPAVTSTSLSSTENPAAPNSTVAVTATVANQSSNVAPVGAIQFYVDGNAVLTPQPINVTSQSAIDVQAAAGSYRITGQYVPQQSPGPDFSASAGGLTQAFGVPNITPPSSTSGSSSDPSGGSPSGTGTGPDSSFFLGKPALTSDGTIVLSAQSRQAGKFSFSASRVRGRGPAAYGHGSRTSNGKNPVSLVIHPSASARKALVKYGTMTLHLTVTFTSARGGKPRSAVLPVTVHHRVTRTKHK